jgi:ribosomal protein L31E
MFSRIVNMPLTPLRTHSQNNRLLKLGFTSLRHCVFEKWPTRLQAIKLNARLHAFAWQRARHGVREKVRVVMDWNERGSQCIWHKGREPSVFCDARN